jgi:hypothetical protein
MLTFYLICFSDFNASDALPDHAVLRSSPNKRKSQSRTAPKSNTFPVSLAHYYIELLTSRAMAGGLVIVPSRSTLVLSNVYAGNNLGAPPNSKSQSGNAADGAPAIPPNTFRPDYFTGLEQLTDLARLLGPNGIAAIDNRILRYIQSLGSNIAISFNSLTVGLGNLTTGMISNQKLVGGGLGAQGTLAAFTTCMQKIKTMDEHREKLIALGYLLELRTILYNVLKKSMDSSSRPYHRLLMACSTKLFYSSCINHGPEVMDEV